MSFAKPEYLYLLIAVPLLLAGWFIAGRLRQRALNVLSDRRLMAELADSVSPGRRQAKFALTLAALACLIVAAARPQFGNRLELVEQRGLDVMVVLDVSSSMLARDIAPSRLEKAKLEVHELLDRLPAANTGLVVFAGASFVQFPLTNDPGAARMLLDAAGPQSVSLAGTAIGDAIRRATSAFDQKTLKYRVMLLLTDGEDHGSDPLSAARQAAEQGVVIYAIGFGRPEGEPIPILNSRGQITDFKRDRNGQMVLSRLDEATLQQVAAVTGGAYYRATPSGREIAEIVAQVGRLEQREQQSQFQVQRVERFQIPLALALIALAGELLLSERRRRRPARQ